MSIQVGLNNSQIPIMVQPNVDSKSSMAKASFKGHASEPEASTKVKVGTFLTTLLGVGTAMAFVFKKNKSVDFKGFKDFKSVKDYFKSFIKIKYDDEHDELAKAVAKMGVGSVAGGLLGGAILDKKENFTAKCRESIIQLIGNISIPLILVAGGGKLFKKYAATKVNQALKLEGKKVWKVKMEDVPQVVAQTGLLIAGIFAGNSVGNFINKTFFKVDEKRKIKLTDMSPHLDDVCVSAGLVAPKVALVSRFVPPALLIAGSSVGSAQEAPLRVEMQKQKAAQKLALKQAKIASKQKANT